MENRKIPKDEGGQGFFKANGESKSPYTRETGFQILDSEDTTQIPCSKGDQSPGDKCSLRIPDPHLLHSTGNAIDIDQEEEIWADLERRIHAL